jgi:hypothetical protein
VTDNDQDGFTAPTYQRPTPPAIKAAGKRLYDYALITRVPKDMPILNVAIPDDLAELQQDQRLLTWFVAQRDGE